MCLWHLTHYIKMVQKLNLKNNINLKEYAEIRNRNEL